MASVYSVSQVNSYIKNMFAQDLPSAVLRCGARYQTASTIHQDIYILR